MPVFECRTEVGVSPKTLFEFITNVANMKAIAPSDVDMTIIEAPDELALGSKIVFQVQAFGVKQQLVHEVVEFQSPERFREKMVKGPMTAWTHDYIVEPHGTTGAALTNRIEFEPPGGMLGMLLTADRILGHLEEDYARRSEALKKALQP